MGERSIIKVETASSQTQRGVLVVVFFVNAAKIVGLGSPHSCVDFALGRSRKVRACPACS